MTITLRNWQSELRQIDDVRRRRRNAARQIATFRDPKAVARRARVLRRAFPHASPNVLMPLARNGVEPGSKVLDDLIELETRRRARKGEFKKPGEETDGSFEAAAARAKAKIEEHNRLTPFAAPMPTDPETLRNVVENAAAGVGQLTGALDYLPVIAPIKATLEGQDPTTIIGRAFPGAKAWEDLRGAAAGGVDEIPGPVGAGLRGVSRGVQLALSTPMEMVNASIRSAVAGDRPTPDDPFGVDVMERQFRQTQGGQATIDLVEGRPVDVGGGWFPDPKSRTGRAASEEARLQSPYLIGGHAWTPGRYVANEVFAPDTVPFDILSGSVDAAATLALDPINMPAAAWTAAKRGQRVVAARTATDDVGQAYLDARAAVTDARAAVRSTDKARRRAQAAFDQAGPGEVTTDTGLILPGRNAVHDAQGVLTDATAAHDLARTQLDEALTARTTARNAAVEAAGGYGNGSRPWLRRQQATEWFATEQGARVVDYHVANGDAYDSWLRYGQRGPREFHQALADATTRDDVMGILDEHLGTALREFPVAKRFTPNWRPALDQHRWAHNAPNQPALYLDAPEEAMVQADRWMRNAQIPREARARIFNGETLEDGTRLPGLVDAADPEDWYEVSARMAGVVEDELVASHGIPRSAAEVVTSLFGMRTPDALKRYAVDAVTGENMDSPLVILGDHGRVVPTPHLDVEQFSTSIPLPDYKEIRKLTKTYGGAAERLRGRAEHLAAREKNPELQAAYQRIADGKDWIDYYVGARAIEPAMKLWRKMRLFRPAWGVRVVAEEQARLWQYGLIGLFDHPLTAIAIAAGVNPDSKLARTLNAAADTAEYVPVIGKGLAKRWRPKLTAGGAGDDFMQMEELGESLNQPFADFFETAGTRGLAKQARRPDSHLWDVAEKGDRRWAGAVAEEIVRLRRSPTARAVAASENPQDAVEWLLHGEGRHQFDRVFRPERMVRSSPDAAPRAVAELTDAELEQTARWYVDTVWSRIQGVSNNDSRVLAAIRDGDLDGVKVMGFGRGHDDLVAKVDDLSRNGWDGPSKTRARLEINVGGQAGRRHGFVDTIMWNIMPRPSNYLSRSPGFRQFYWQRAGELAGFLTPDAKARLLVNAEKANVGDDVIAAIRLAPSDAGGITLREADEFARAYALSATKDLLYDLSEKGQVWDQLKLIFPFGEAYQEVLSRWAKAVWENPMVLRRLGQGVEEARETGFFQKGPFGQEVFVYPGAEWLTDKLVGVPVPISGSVSGLNIAGSGLPGVGPVVQIPAAYLIPNKPSMRTLQELIFPYGEQGYGGSLEEGGATFVLPQWAKHGARFFFDSPESDKQFGSTVGYLMNYLASTGDYELHGPDAATEADRLLKDATSAAKKFSLVRAMFSAAAPTAPIPRWAIRDKDNQLVELTVLREHYYKRAQRDGGDAAFAWLIDTYGAKNFLAAQGLSRTNGVLPRTQSQWDWVAEHPWSRDLYPETFGLLAPPDPKGDFDITGYSLAEEGGERERLTPKERLALANHRLASFIYDKEAAEFGDDPTDEQQDWLDGLKDALEQEYPGYNTQPTDFAYTKRRVLELQRAVRDERLAKARPGLVAATRDYLTLRDDALDLQNGRGLTSRQVSTAASAEDIREWLRESARAIIRAHPEFRAVWDEVFRRELG